MYTSGLRLNGVGGADVGPFFLDLDVSVSGGIISIIMYDKQVDFN